MSSTKRSNSLQEISPPISVQNVPQIYVGGEPYRSNSIYPTVPGNFIPSRTQPEELRLTWFENQQKNRPQGNSIAPGLMVALSAGLHFSWGVTRLVFLGQWVAGVEKNELYHIISAWFTGLGTGGLISAFTAYAIRKRHFYLTSSILMIISSILLLQLPHSFAAILSARYIAGLSFGLAVIPLVCHASEVACRENRGQILASINFIWIISMFIAAIFVCIDETQLVTSFGFDRMLGILSLVYSLLGAAGTFVYKKESPVYLLKNNLETEARTTIMRLRTETLETYATQQDLIEMRTMVNEDQAQSKNIFVEGNLLPLANFMLLHGLYALSLSMPINASLALMSAAFIESAGGPTNFTSVFLFFFRLISEIICYFVVDRVGRRKLVLSSAGLCGTVLIIMASLKVGGVTAENYGVLSFFFEFFAGCGLGTVAATYGGEAFPIRKKGFSLLAGLLIEIFIHLITIHFVLEDSFYPENVFFAMGSLQILGALYLYFMMPETYKLSLRDCHIKRMS